nr:SRPBCC domain-containing protein [Trebonia kvetii]
MTRGSPGSRAAASCRSPEIERPVRLEGTWVFDGRPEAEAMETVELREEDGVTTMTDRLAFKDQATRDSMKRVKPDGVHADDGGQVAWDRLEDYLTTLA